jgi:hypothetical protein
MAIGLGNDATGCTTRYMRRPVEGQRRDLLPDIAPTHGMSAGELSQHGDRSRIFREHVHAALAQEFLGYVFKKIDIPLAPLILTLILGPLMEQSLRQSLEMSRGKFSIFVEHPISLGFIIVAILFAAASTMRGVSKVRGADSEV